VADSFQMAGCEERLGQSKKTFGHIAEVPANEHLNKPAYYYTNMLISIAE